MNENEILKYQLSTLEAQLPDDLDSDEFDVAYEDEIGIEFFESTSVIDVAAKALQYITELEAKLEYYKTQESGNEKIYTSDTK